MSSDNEKTLKAQSIVNFLSQEACACPNCKYSLYQIAAPSCPECGNAIKLVVSDNRRDKAMSFLAVVGLAGPFIYNSLSAGKYFYELVSLRGISSAPDVVTQAWYRGVQALLFGILLLLFIATKNGLVRSRHLVFISIGAATIWLGSILWLVWRSL